MSQSRIIPRHTSKPSYSRSTRSMPCAMLLSLTMLTLVWAGATGDAHAQEPSGGIGRAPGGRVSDPVVRAADIAAPAVVRISTLYDSHITMNVCGTSVTLPRTQAGYTEGVLGSGAFVSAHGDILTADHLIHVDDNTLTQQLFADPAADADIVDAFNTSSCFGYGPPLAASDIANGFLQSAAISYTTSFTSPQTYVWRDTWYSGAATGAQNDKTDMLKSLQSAPHDQASILAISDFAHDDLAVLHVNAQNTPSIRLDDASTVQTLDNLTVIGFPGNGDANNDPTNLLTPSFNLANVSAIKTNDYGAELIQVGGNIEHGDSGGPALDANGRIVGVVSFGGPDNQGITAFLRSSDSARRLIATAKVQTTPSALEIAWERAFADYASTTPGHWHSAAREFAALLKAYPQFHGAAPYAAWAQTQARHERLPQRHLTLPFGVLIALTAIGALALLGVLLVLLKASRSTPLLWRDITSVVKRRGAKPGQPKIALSDSNGSAPLEELERELAPVSQRVN